MLYDPKWDQQTKADPFTVAALVAWLETKPATETYDYYDCGGACLYGQYMTHVGVPWKEARFATYADNRKGDIHEPFRMKVYFPIAVTYPHTFGAALERARASLSSPQGTKS